MPSTQPDTAVANSAKKNSRPRSRASPRGRRRDHGLARLRQRLDLARPAPRRARPRCAGTRTRGRRRRPSGSPSGSSATGRMPLPSLPVDSAISCSTQRPKLDTGSETMNVSLSRPCSASSPIARPIHSPELDARAVEAVAVLLGLLRGLQQRLDVHAHQRRRHQAEVRQHRVAPADVRVVLEHPPEAALLGHVDQPAAGVGDRHELRAVAAGALVEVLHVRQRLHRAARLRGDDEQRLRQVHAAPPARAPRRGRSSRARAA